MRYGPITLVIFTVCLLLAVPITGGADVEPDLWPSLVEVYEHSGGRFCFGISGLYGDREQWSRNSNQINRMFDKFTDSDSLYFELDNAIAWLYTRRNRETVPELIDWLASFNGIVPTWDELLARDQISHTYAFDNYQLLGRKDFEGPGSGLRHFGLCKVGDSSHVFRFYDNPYRGPLIGAYELRVSWTRDRNVDFTFAAVDSVTAAEVYKHESDETPRLVKLRLAGGKSGIAKLNATTAHCKGEMQHALRVYDDSGHYYWSTETDLNGICSVWCRDFDGDGVDEILVLAQEHGRQHVLVFGNTRPH